MLPRVAAQGAWRLKGDQHTRARKPEVGAEPARTRDPEKRGPVDAASAQMPFSSLQYGAVLLQGEAMNRTE